MNTTPARSYTYLLTSATKLVAPLVVATCLAISASYEFLEWWIALIAGVAAEDFLATQGDVWDTQWDMFLATTGAVVALLTLSGAHDRALARLLRT